MGHLGGLPTRRFPIMRQPVPAGGSTPNDAEYLELPLDLPGDCIAVPVSGECMLDTIAPGDYVIVNRDMSPQPKDVCVLLIDGETTLKRVQRRNGVWELHADNPAFEPVEVRASEITVIGVVVQVVTVKGKP
jgi:DNA polymerase V